MNLMNQRRDLQDAYDEEMITKDMLQVALQSPVFICEGRTTRTQYTKEEVEWIGQNVMHMEATADGMYPKIIPYDCFRIVADKSRSYMQWWFDWDAQTATCLYCPDRSLFPDDLVIDISDIHFRFKLNRWKPEAMSRVWFNFKPVPSMQLEDRGPSLGKIFDGCIDDLVHFLFEIMSNSSTALKVTDDQPGRSVQWRLNREHYVLINNHQAQTMQKKKKGITNKDIIRGAHWRRAHLRRLMSDKFKHKKGLLVAVRKAWIGPEEWKGHDGKIYKVVTITPKQH